MADLGAAASSQRFRVYRGGGALKLFPCCTFCPKIDRKDWIRRSPPGGSLPPPTGTERKCPESFSGLWLEFMYLLAGKR